MGTARNLKYEIIAMRNDGLSYRQIEKELQCSKGTINYHCKSCLIHAYDGQNNYISTIYIRLA